MVSIDKYLIEFAIKDLGLDSDELNLIIELLSETGLKINNRSFISGVTSYLFIKCEHLKEYTLLVECLEMFINILPND